MVGGSCHLCGRRRRVIRYFDIDGSSGRSTICASSCYGPRRSLGVGCSDRKRPKAPRKREPVRLGAESYELANRGLPRPTMSAGYCGRCPDGCRGAWRPPTAPSLRADHWIRPPDRGHEVAANNSSSTHASIRSALHAMWREPIHRLVSGTHGIAKPGNLRRDHSEPVMVGR